MPEQLNSFGKGSASKTGAPPHPGRYVRETALNPKKMSVTAAAALIGISRPSASNFLNGKVGVTPEMATRIERAFNIPTQTLLDMQAAYDGAVAKSKGAPSNTKPYVPPFLALKANDIEQWASQNIAARSRLAVFLRTLVHSTAVGLTKVDFPGNDDAERPGWDGFVEASAGTPWIPRGLSGWEFGVNQNIKGKADADFTKSIKAVRKAERHSMTFIFVTPQRWSGKATWTAEARAKRQWNDVRAYDAQDLEQWLEQSIVGQTWLANETCHPSAGVRSLDKCWRDWADVASPPLSSSLFSSAIDDAKHPMLSRLSQPWHEPIIIAADSVEEALAFLSTLFSDVGGKELASYRDRILVFDKPGTLPRLADGAQNFIAVAVNREVERELAPLATSLQSIIVYPRNAVTAKPHIVLEPISYENFRLALEDMDYNSDDVAKYSNESGRSLTVLRRRLSNIPAVRKPEWAADTSTAASLVPFSLAGAWNSKNEADLSALSLLANDLPYEILERECQRLTLLNDAPMWSIGDYRGVVSKVDALFAIAGSITTPDLNRYLGLARRVLGEDDATLDLPERERWLAPKSRQFSSALRDGLSETLVLLAVYGNNLFKSRLGFDAEIEVAGVVRALLPMPLTTRSLEANNHDLPTYAEAAPDEFLSIIERDLRTERPAVLGLLRPVDSGVLGVGPSRTGLLWALEGLSWNPRTLPRAALILARLAQTEINDNWSNKPIGSLGAIFRAWMPQTAATHDERLRLMTKLAECYPDVAWKLCVEQFDPHDQVGHYSHKPRWRPDGYGFGEPFATVGPRNLFAREMVHMALTWEGHSRDMLCDLIERLHGVDGETQAKVWNLVASWAERRGSDADKAALREKIRVAILSWRGAMRSKKGGANRLTSAAQAAYAALAPCDLLNKHEWLFRDGWIEETAEDVPDGARDYRRHEERVTKLRVDVLREVLAQRGLPGIFDLAERGNTGERIGWLLARHLLPKMDRSSFLLEALGRPPEIVSPSKTALVRGALRSIDDDAERMRVLQKVAKQLSQAELVRLLLLAPFCRSTWKMVDALDETHRGAYWTEVVPDWIHKSDRENAEGVLRLLASQRPRAAFSCVCYEPDKVDPALLFRLLTEMAQGGKEEAGSYQVEQYYIERCFVLIDKSQGLTMEEKARLELAYLGVLARPYADELGYGIPNLEKYIEEHPEVFVQAVVWLYKRQDGGEDPDEFRVAREKIVEMAERGHGLLGAFRRIPGHDKLGELKTDRLAKWVKTVRAACAELGRSKYADLALGQLLANAPGDEDGVWPCEPVRDVMEDIQSEAMSDGAHTGLYNARGIHWRGEGGDQERGLADKYRAWADALQYSHPFVASSLLRRMVVTYEREAGHEDAMAGMKRRMR